MSTCKHYERWPEPESTSGLFAMLRALLGTGGSGASKISRTIGAPVLAAMVAMCGLATFTAAPAHAAGPPEAPKTEPAREVTGTTAILEGVLNPGAPGAMPGEEYVFFYSWGGSACNEGNVRVAPEPFGMVGQKAKELVFPPVVLAGLRPDTLYRACLAARYPGEGWAYGSSQSFTTLSAPPAIAGEGVSSVTAGTARLEGAVNPESELTECRVQYGKTSVTEQEAPCEPATLNGFGAQGVGAPLAGLEQRTSYRYRIIAENAQSRTEGTPTLGEEKTFTTVQPPEAPEAEPATAVTGATATLHGVVNPGHEGEPGSYEFVYRSSATGCQGVGGMATPTEPSSSSSPQPVSAPVAGLLPNTTYAFCLRATNAANETALSPPQVFTTPAVPPSVGEESISDVSAKSATLHAQVDPGGEPTKYWFEYATEAEYAATDSYSSATPVESAGAGSEAISVLGLLNGLQPDTAYDFRVVAGGDGEARGADTKFSTFPVAPLGLPDGRRYELVSPLENGDASVLLPQQGDPVRAAANGSALLYRGQVPPFGGNGELKIEFQNRKHANQAYLARRSANGGWTAGDIQPSGKDTVYFTGFSSDLSLAFATSERPLTAGAPPSGEQALYSRNESGAITLLGANTRYSGSSANGSDVLLEREGNLYDSVAGQLDPVNVLPGGAGLSAPHAAYGDDGAFGELSNVISSDGSRVFWSLRNSEGNPEQLFVTENVGAADQSTVEVDKAEAGCGSCTGGNGVFQTAAPDGSTVFFTDERALTSDSTATAGAPDLYEYDVTDGTLTDISVSAAGTHANVRGVLGTSENGSYVYFAAAGALPNTGATPQQCLPNSYTSKCNVYLVHEREAPQLIATVAAIDGEGSEYAGSGEEKDGDWVPFVGEHAAFVSADGRHLVFQSTQDLTGFRAEGTMEIYVYDVGSGLSCVSCNPSGSLALHQGYLWDRTGPNITLPMSEVATYGLRDVSADGDRVFFESNEALVPGVANANLFKENGLGTERVTNVYEWERDGSGSCTRERGCLYLLNGGTSSAYSFFLDASATGDDVFMGTRAQLVPQDHGEYFQVFDAHVCSSAAPCPVETSTACTGTGCQGIPGQPPIFETPSSVTFNGIGNFPPPSPVAVVKPGPKSAKCAKGEKRVRGKCVKGKKKARAGKSANANRGTRR
jgi:hypothetical protein